MLSGVAVALLWRPAGASDNHISTTFAQALARCEIPAAALEMSLYGRSNISLRGTDIADLAAACLRRDDMTVPAEISESVRDSLPREIETVSGCTVSPDGIVLFLRCRKLVTFYVTVAGRLVHNEAGGLDFRLTGASVGIVPLPVEFAREHLGLQDAPVIVPDDAGFSVAKCESAVGTITLDLVEYDGGENH